MLNIQDQIETATRHAFFGTYFKTPRQVRLGVWMITALGDLPVDEDVRIRAGFPTGTTMYEYADALIGYAESKGWAIELAALLQEDIKDAFLEQRARNHASRYLQSRQDQGASKDQPETTHE